MNKYEKLLKINKILEPIIDTSILIFLSILLYALFGRVFPERYFIYQMDNLMIENGEAITLVLIYLFATFTIVTYIIRFIVFLIINSNLFYNLKPNFNKNNKFILLCLYTLNTLNTLVPILFLFFHYLVNNLKYKNKLIVNENLNKKRENSKRLVAYTFPFAITALTATPILAVTLQPAEVVVNKKTIEDNLTFSNNHNNTLFLYFDRSLGTLWNMLLKVDEVINGDKSFIKENPGFTSFLNTISNSNATNISNLTISGGLWSLPYFFGKNKSFNNPVDNLSYMNMTQDDAYGNALLSQVKLLSEYNFKNISYMDVPYFGKTFTELHGEYWKLNSYFNKHGFPNATSTSSTAILKYNKQKYENANSDGLRYLQYIGNNNLHFKNTDYGTSKFLYHQITHENYTFFNHDGKIISKGSSFQNFVKSIWSAIKELKNLFNDLRNQKYVGTDKNGENDNVYNHTYITILSDHGIRFNKDETDKSLKSISTILSLNSNSVNKLKNYFYQYPYANNNTIYVNPSSFNSVFMIKPFNDTNSFKYDNSHFVSSCDYNLFLEEQLKKVSKIDSSINNPITFSPIVDKSKYSQSTQDYIINSIIANPLANLDKLNNRTIIAMSSNNWRWRNDRKDFDLTNFLLKVKTEPNKTIWDNVYYRGSAKELVW